MRLVIVGAYPFDSTRISTGVEAVVVCLVRALRDMDRVGIQVVSHSPRIAREETHLLDAVPVHFVPASKRLGNVSLGALQKVRTARRIRALAPDIVHVHNHSNYPYLLGAPPHPTITTVHGLVAREVRYETEPIDRLRSLPRRFLEKLALRRATHLIAVSAYVKDILTAWTSATIDVVENPVSSEYFGIPTNKTSDRPTLLFAGSLTERKNVLGLLRVVAALRERRPSLSARIAGGPGRGEPQYRERLRQFVREHQLQDNVSFLGQLPEDQLRSEYARCDLVVSCSYEETSGLVLQQAMAAGKPCVATRNGGFSCVVRDGETGFLVDPDADERFAAHVERLLLDPPLRERLGRSGREEALRRFAPSVAAAATLRLYEGLLEGAPEPGRRPAA